MNSLLKLIKACDPTIAASYDRRKVGRDDINGLTVSTCWTDDQGYETALVDSLKTYTVERYEDREEAVQGHSKWCIQAETIEQITSLGYDDITSDKEVTVVRNQTK